MSDNKNKFTMYEKLELERIKLDLERMKFESDRLNKDNRFRCLELASRFACDNDVLLKEAAKLAAFVESK